VPYTIKLLPLRKTAENPAAQKQKITQLHYFIYTKTDAFLSRKIFDFIAPKPVLSPAEGSAFFQASRAIDLLF